MTNPKLKLVAKPELDQGCLLAKPQILTTKSTLIATSQILKRDIGWQTLKSQTLKGKTWKEFTAFLSPFVAVCQHLSSCAGSDTLSLPIRERCLSRILQTQPTSKPWTLKPLLNLNLQPVLVHSTTKPCNTRNLRPIRHQTPNQQRS